MSNSKKVEITILALHLGIGGIENSIAFLSNMLSKNYDVTIISTYNLPNSPAIKLNDNVKIEYLTKNLAPNKEQLLAAVKQKNIKNIFKEGFLALKILFLKRHTMIRKIKQIDSKIIISTRSTFSKWLGKYGKKTCIKIAQEHNHHNNNKKHIKKIINSLKKIDYFMPVSQELTDFYAKQLYYNKKIKCFYIPHGLTYFPDQCANIEKKQIISVGRLDPIKGFLDLIDIFKILEQQAPDWTLTIVGGGEQYDELNKKIYDMGLEKKVFLLGPKNRDEINNIFSNSSVYLMTSYSESFGLVLLEAESFGIPLVAFDSAQGAKEIIKNGKNGFLISNRDKKEMVNKVLNLINNTELRYNMGQYGRNLALNHTEKNIQKKWEIFLNEIL